MHFIVREHAVVPNRVHFKNYFLKFYFSVLLVSVGQIHGSIAIQKSRRQQ